MIRGVVKSITIVTQTGTSSVCVGYGGVDRIVNNSIETDNGESFLAWLALDTNGNVLREIINCPVDVVYYPIAK